VAVQMAFRCVKPEPKPATSSPAWPQHIRLKEEDGYRRPRVHQAPCYPYPSSGLVDSIFRSGPKDASSRPAQSQAGETSGLGRASTKASRVVMDKSGEVPISSSIHGQASRPCGADRRRARSAILVTQSMKLTLVLGLIHRVELVWRSAHVFSAGRARPNRGICQAPWPLAFWKRRLSRVISRGRPPRTSPHSAHRASRQSAAEVASLLPYHAAYSLRRISGPRFPLPACPWKASCTESQSKQKGALRHALDGLSRVRASIVKLRSLYLSETRTTTGPFHVAQDQLRIHPTPGRCPSHTKTHRTLGLLPPQTRDLSSFQN